MGHFQEAEHGIDSILAVHAGAIIAYGENAYADVWIPLSSELDGLHGSCAVASYIEMKRLMLDELPAEVPQPCDVSRVLETATGFRLARASGMTDTPTFLRFLAKRIFAATTFLRAPHELQFTSQPDWIHEFYGHAVSLVDDRMARLYEHFGRAASSASTRTAMTHLEQLYWYSIETSVIRDQASSRAIGAALLSSVSELHGMASYVKLPFDPVAMAATPYRSDVPQQTVFEARSFDEYLDSLHDYLHFLER